MAIGAHFSTTDIRFELDLPAWALGALGCPKGPIGLERCLENATPSGGHVQTGAVIR